MTAVQEDIEDIIPPSLSATVPASAPVFRLPPEILARIFSTYAESEHWTFKEVVRDEEGNWLEEDTSDSSRTAGEQVGWINVTHVCRRWRENPTLAWVDYGPWPPTDELERRLLDVPTASFPAFRSLGVTGFRLSSTSSVLENLAHIDIDRVSSAELYAILFRITNLETISTTLMDDEDPSPLPS
ncbi:hypothetical protein BV25DRAFT_1920742 [Artomyces pyxidatus]|uniref:Uncharacterized protein n=1 Tax=Artomyces pyxidatus TaxID=48021 RepID=A0ACB8SKD5_9AGAM|nr:hypothetical protein BV25DRAFT_1920742 [Artomyces pyxidatus]